MQKVTQPQREEQAGISALAVHVARVLARFASD
jgi:hypothetical protein